MKVAVPQLSQILSHIFYVYTTFYKLSLEHIKVKEEIKLCTQYEIVKTSLLCVTVRAPGPSRSRLGNVSDVPVL